MVETQEQQVPTRVVRYGADRPLPDRRTLRAGPVTAVLENGDLRYVKVGDIEVVRRLYMAVRNQNWDTIEGRFTSYDVDDRGDAFTVRFSAEHIRGAVDFVWDGLIEGSADGTIAYSLDGQPRRSFLRNRIGFCVLHPMDLAGAEVDVTTPNGIVHGVFPVRISPHQPFVDMVAISHPAGPDARFTIEFDGDLFEMEDQRNWTDASYKTYSTPLRIPYPVPVEPGQRIVQKVTLSITGAVTASQSPSSMQDISIGTAPIGTMPRIGLTAFTKRGLDAREVELLRVVKPAHLQVGLDLADEAWQARLQEAAMQARNLGTGLELSVIAGTPQDGFEALAHALVTLQVPVERVFVFPPVDAPVTFPRHDLETSRNVIDVAREAFQGNGLRVPLGGGTRAYFTELNRAADLPIDQLDVVTYTLNPQVHAFDNLSLVETLAAQAVTIESAKEITGSRPLAIGPIALAPPYNPNATGSLPPVRDDELPASVDPRQLSLFGAGWTIGSLHRLAEAGADSLTYYLTVGWRGLIERSEGLTRRSLFPSQPGQLFPLYHVFAAVAEFRRADMLPVTLRDPLTTEVLALRAGDRFRLLVANFEDTDQTLTIDLPRLSQASVRYLDETTAAVATSDPEFWRGSAGDAIDASSGHVELKLKPFAVARLVGSIR